MLGLELSGDSVGMSDTGGGDFFSPGVGQVIKPDGTIEYDFEGRIKATGLTLDEYQGAEAEPPASQVIGFEDVTNGNVDEKIWAQMGGVQATSNLYAITNQNKKRPNGDTRLIAYDKNGNQVFLSTLAKEVEAKERKVWCGAGPTGSQRTVIDAAQRSSFLQIGPLKEAAAAPVFKTQILGGVVSGAGAVVTGAGFTVAHPEVGKYTITITNELAETPVVLCNHTGAAGGWGFTTPNTVGKASFKVEVRNGLGELKNEEWCFILFG